MNKKEFDIQLFGEGTAEGTGGSSENVSGLTGDFEQDFNKYVLGKESAPVSHKEVSENSETEGTAEEEETEAESGNEPEEKAGENNSEADPEKEFEELIKGKYKGAFQKRTQGIINERFKASKETEGKLKAAMNALAPLFDRYGIEETDLEGLAGAVKGDAAIFAKRALEQGMDSEAYRDNFNAQRETKQKADEEQARERMQQARDTYEDWKKQEKEIKKTYPAFDLSKAYTENEEFKNMLHSGTSVLNAYRATHFDELTAGIVAAATQRAAKKTVDSMKTNVRRPQEGGIGSQAGTVSKTDVNSLTDKDIYSILERVRRGETISF